MSVIVRHSIRLSPLVLLTMFAVTAHAFQNIAALTTASPPLFPVTPGLQAQPTLQPTAPPAASVATTEESAPLTEQQGEIFLEQGHYMAAIRSFEGAEPKSAAIYNKLGIAYEHMRLNDRARENFVKALQLNPKFAQVYNNLGTLAHSEGDFKRAEKLYKRAMHFDPKSAEAEKNLGTLYYAHGKFRKGDDAYRRARELDEDVFARRPHAPIQAAMDTKNSADLHYHLARTYASAGSDTLAMEYLRQAVNEGFKDRKRLLSDQQFAALWNTPAFMKLVEDLKTN